jgi:hypothetical protein
LTIELLQRGTSLGVIPAQLPAADASGRIQYTGALPLETIPAGKYEMKVIVKSGTAAVSRSVDFTIE